MKKGWNVFRNKSEMRTKKLEICARLIYTKVKE